MNVWSSRRDRRAQNWLLGYQRWCSRGYTYEWRLIDNCGIRELMLVTDTEPHKGLEGFLSLKTKQAL